MFRIHQKDPHPCNSGIIGIKRTLIESPLSFVGTITWVGGPPKGLIILALNLHSPRLLGGSLTVIEMHLPAVLQYLVAGQDSSRAFETAAQTEHLYGR